jgi:hyaluronoglucosaminidase
VRGIVEGFYGTPWSHEARLDVLAFVAARGMNAYAYAPKDDAKHRSQWREPYAADEMARFAELASACAQLGMRFGFGISPGLDITYESEPDRRTLLDKLEPLAAGGVTWFLLLVDDIPLQPDLAPRQADLTAALCAALPDVAFTVCPTEYVGTRPSQYLADLAAGLPPGVDVMWTGPTVCSPRITVDDAKDFTFAIGGRPPLVWDNFPVNDAMMTNSLHLGPYTGRDAGLADIVGGVLCNPMTQPRASKIALATAAAYLSDPDNYAEHTAWETAIADVGGSRATPLRALAHACGDSPLHRPADLELARLVADAAFDEIETVLRAARELPDVFTADGDALAVEVAPWAAAAGTEAEAGLAALRLIKHVLTPEPDAERAMHQAFALLYSWSVARTNTRVVFGPRFALYTPVVQLADGRPALDVGLAVREDENAVDALCRLALATYQDWTTSNA